MVAQYDPITIYGSHEMYFDAKLRRARGKRHRIEIQSFYARTHEGGCDVESAREHKSDLYKSHAQEINNPRTV